MKSWLAGGGADRGTLFESGDELINRIRNAIILRRPVLVTGPRGSGKSHCAREAIRLAIEAGEIGGSRFLQGNRELPREYLSEDMLVVREGADGRPELTLVDALVIRHPTLNGAELKQKRQAQGDVWPAAAADPRTKPKWEPGDWTVLFLDEINRFGDGFLDSLLSLTEERTIVRGGDELRVPLTVVATANPPGYDVTAKKLSPPLQSRMARSYRVAQPSLEALSLSILPELVKRHGAELARRPDVSSETISLCAGIGLCLWGTPSESRKGTGFLTSSTIKLLKQAMILDPVLAAAMDELGELIAFGPDARSIGDWLGSAMGAAAVLTDGKVEHAHLMDTVLEALGHKLRETFNEGVEPGKAVRVSELIVSVASSVLDNTELQSLLSPPYEPAARHFFTDVFWDPTGQDDEAIEKEKALFLGNEMAQAEARYLLARRFSTLRGAVDALVKGERVVTALSGTVSHARALLGLGQDLTTRAANAATVEEGKALAALARRVAKVLTLVGQQSVSLAVVIDELQAQGLLPTHSALPVLEALHAGEVSMDDAVAGYMFAKWALAAAAGPRPQSKLEWLSPAVADWIELARLGPQLRELGKRDWTPLTQRFEAKDPKLLPKLASALARELHHAPARRLVDRIRHELSSPAQKPAVALG